MSNSYDECPESGFDLEEHLLQMESLFDADGLKVRAGEPLVIRPVGFARPAGLTGALLRVRTLALDASVCVARARNPGLDAFLEGAGFYAAVREVAECPPSSVGRTTRPLIPLRWYRSSDRHEATATVEATLTSRRATPDTLSATRAVDGVLELANTLAPTRQVLATAEKYEDSNGWLRLEFAAGSEGQPQDLANVAGNAARVLREVERGIESLEGGVLLVRAAGKVISCGTRRSRDVRHATAVRGVQISVVMQVRPSE